MDSHAYWELRYCQGTDRSQAPTPFAELFLERLPALQQALRRAPRVLELGAGNGRDALAIAGMGARVVALELAFRGIVGLHGAGGVFPVVSDLREPLPFRTGTFDAVYSHLSLSCAFRDADVCHLFREIRRLLAPGGILWLAVRSTEDPTYVKGSQPGAGHQSFGETGLHFYSIRSMRGFLKDFAHITLDRVRREVDGEPYGMLEVRAAKDFNPLSAG